MKNSKTHFYLYAKHWYKRTNVIDDLKVIVAKYCGHDIKYSSVSDIKSILISLTWPYIVNSGNPEYYFTQFVGHLDPKESWKVGQMGEPDYDVRFINACLSILSLTKVSDIPNGLDEADYSILPSNKEFIAL